MFGLSIKFRHLRTFVEVARQASVGRAAEVLHVSQPAVSKTLRELEASLGATLIEKDGRGIRVTRYGQVFLQHAGASLAAIQRGIDSVAREKSSAGPRPVASNCRCGTPLRFPRRCRI